MHLNTILKTSREIMESDLEQHPSMLHGHQQHQQQQQQQQQQMNSGLTRYRSAPSSYFTNIIDKEFYEDMFNRPSSPETERVFSRFVNSLAGDDSPSQYLSPVRQNSAVKEEEITQQPQVLPSINNNEPVILQQQQQNNINNSFGSVAQNLYQTSGRPPLPNQSMTSSGMEEAYSMGVHRLPNMKSGDGNNSNLIRHNSSPAGLFSHINIENGMSYFTFSREIVSINIPFYDLLHGRQVLCMRNFVKNFMEGEMQIPWLGKKKDA